MEIQEIKQYIFDNQKIEDVLVELGMKNIKPHDNCRYYTCAFPDGDNPHGCVVYNNEVLNVTAYTRNIIDMYDNSDLISLVVFVKNMYFYQALKWICDLFHLDYYAETCTDLPKSIILMKKLFSMGRLLGDDEDVVNRPIDENILRYYYQYPNRKWIDEGITLDTQRMFEIGLDYDSRRITIPIRDEVGVLVGVKGRIYYDGDSDKKYMYLEKCQKTRILYGLHITLPYIQQCKEVLVVEAEKSVMKLYSYGIKNAVSVGGHNLSKRQVTMLTRLGVKVVIAFDKDVKEKVEYGEICNDTTVLAECYKFLNFVTVEYIMDKDNLLEENEAPCDNRIKWEKLYSSNRYCFVR